MSGARPTVSVYDLKGNAIDQLALPSVFTAPIRTDIVQFVHAIQLLNTRQAHAVNPKAGHQTSAESWGTGRAVSRIPRVPGGGTHRAGQGAFGNMCRGGRMFAPTHPWRKWHRKSNKKLRRYAIASAVAASALPSIVMAKGHLIPDAIEIPLVVDDSLEGISKTKSVVDVLKAIGAYDDVEKSKNSKRVRSGKGKQRNGRWLVKKGPLIIYGQDGGIAAAVNKLPGVSIRRVTNLSLQQLAPGGHVGRFVIWTKSAFEELDRVFGTKTESSELKKGFKVPTPCVASADMTRIIRSEEVQDVVRAPRKEVKVKMTRCKPNPLKNEAALSLLNPYAADMKSKAREAAARAVKKQRAAKKVDKELKAANKAFRAILEKESDYQGEDYDEFSKWLGITQ
eukprot:g8982.t1